MLSVAISSKKWNLMCSILRTCLPRFCLTLYVNLHNNRPTFTLEEHTAALIWQLVSRINFIKVTLYPASTVLCPRNTVQSNASAVPIVFLPAGGRAACGGRRRWLRGRSGAARRW